MGKLYALSLFSGAGGFDLGIEAAGFVTKLCTDIDYHSCETLKANKADGIKSKKHSYLSEATIIQKDIKSYTTDKILEDAGLSKEQVSLIYGGPPCQSFSVFGQRKGMDDPRGTLLWDYIRVIKDIQPEVFVLENVAGLLTIDNGKILENFLREISVDINGKELYKVTHYLLDTSNYGVPQFRSRLIVFGAKKKSISKPEMTHTASQSTLTSNNELLPAVTVGQVLSSLPEPPDSNYPNHVGRVHSQRIIERYSNLEFGERDSKTRINRLHPDKPSYTIVVGSDKGGGKGHVHPFSPREVTPRESARIQTFPDYWRFSGTSRHPIRQIGNAVPPVFGAVIGAHIMKEYFNCPSPDYEKIIMKLGLEYIDGDKNIQDNPAI